MLDGGRAYTVKRALELLRRVEEHELYWFEEALQPDDLDGYRTAAPTRRACASRRARRTRRSRRFGRSSSAATSTCCSPISRAAAASPSRARSRSSSAPRPSRSSRTASRPACSSPRRSTSSRRSTGRRGREYSVADSPLVNGILREARSRCSDGRLAVPDRPRPRHRAGRRGGEPVPGGVDGRDRVPRSDEEVRRWDGRGRRPRARNRGRRVHDLRGAVGLRQDDGAAHGRRPRAAYVRRDPHRRHGRQRPRSG